MRSLWQKVDKVIQWFKEIYRRGKVQKLGVPVMTSLKEARMTDLAKVDSLKRSAFRTTKKGSFKSPRANHVLNLIDISHLSTDIS